MACAEGTLKCILNTLNVLMGIGGIGVLVMAVMSLTTPVSFMSIYMIIIGAVTFVGAIIGCCGICREHVALMTAYVVFIGISFVMQIITTFFIDQTKTLKLSAGIAVDLLWNKGPQYRNALQNQRHCCGKNGPGDYADMGEEPPMTCYDNSNHLIQKGCIDAIVEDSLPSNTQNLLSLLFCGLMLAASIYLLMQFRKKQRRYNY